MPYSAAAPSFDAFDALPDPAAILAADGALVRANPAFRAAFRHWIGPNRPPWGRAKPPEFRNGERRFEAAAPDGRRFEWAERLLSDGARLVLARDVSRHAAAADEALRAKTTLFATVTHELRTPLNGILGMTDLLARGALEPNARTYVAAIRQSGELLLDLITEILDYSRLEAGRLELEAAPFDPEAAVQDVAELLSPRANAKGLEIATLVRIGVPARVVGDDGRIRQILFNLAGNALKFTETGGVTIEVAPRPGGRLRFSVRDTGPGVPPEKQALIFEEFAQADAGVARRHGGAGLGLAVVRKLARAMGGECGLASRPGEGAHFWAEAPLQPCAWPSAPRALAGRRVCLHEFGGVSEQALRRTLEALGAEIVALEQSPDVIIADWREEIGAADVALLKQNSPALIAAVAQEDRVALDHARALGFDHYVLKPVRRAALIERIGAALGEESSEAPVRQQLPIERPLQGMRVLVAEDNPINALLARTLLTQAGCSVQVAQDGEEAVAAAEAEPYDLVFLDIRMPRLDGLGAAQRIRAGAGPNANAPLIALTADAGDEERGLALKAGMNDFLTKPIDAARLIAVAERFTELAKPATL